MSDELKPCKHCGGEAKFQIFDTTCNVECQQCGIGTRNELLDNYQVCVYKWNRSADDNLNADVTNLKSDEISLTPDMDERGADSREKLEADLEDMVRSWCADDIDVKATHGAIVYWSVKELLDRQAAITHRETRQSWQDAPNVLDRTNLQTIAELTAERDELSNTVDMLIRRIDGLFSLNNLSDKRIKELEAEVETQRKRANDAEHGVLSDEWYVARDRYEDDVAALTAERDELQAAIDAMGNGQFYAMYRAKCDECDALRERLEAITAALHDKPGT